MPKHPLLGLPQADNLPTCLGKDSRSEEQVLYEFSLSIIYEYVITQNISSHQPECKRALQWRLGSFGAQSGTSPRQDESGGPAGSQANICSMQY